ncbi:MAG: histidine triad nucleotide-binding protein [Chlamydiales bacterium]|nr:histidine triad nucleotide-binding protein [Chlamydiia bacterium]MCP5504253.1 histidine triad nucleotide-binding protein [Chlamydiales bacterium]
MSTIFGKIIKGNLPADKVYENERIIVIKDINPKAPVHLLLIPKKEYPSLQEVPKEDLSIIQEIIYVAQDLARKFDVADNYRLLTNIGTKAGQSVFHLHFHLIGGKLLGDMA